MRMLFFIMPFFACAVIRAQQFGPVQVVHDPNNGAFEDVHFADFDMDGDIDLISCADFSNRVYLHENDGSGSFTTGTVANQTQVPRSVRGADVDGDGDVDILVASFSGDKISWYSNDGSGGFGPQQIITDTADAPVKVRSADLDGDGDIDVLAATFFARSVYWYENDGMGVFTIHHVLYDANSIGSVETLEVGDLDGDGDVDVITGVPTSGEIAWHENNGQGVFSPQVITTQSDAWPVAVWDTDADGDLDVVHRSTGGDIVMEENVGSGSFGTAQTLVPTAPGSRACAFADLDGDGNDDLLWSEFSETGDLMWYAGDGSGGLGPMQLIHTSEDRMNGVGVADVDGDGDLDAFVSAWGSANGRVIQFENNGANVGVAELGVGSMTLMPNPMNDQALVGLEDLSGVLTIEVVDLHGKVQRSDRMLSGNGQYYVLPRGDLKPGNYVLRMITKIEVISLPFMVE